MNNTGLIRSCEALLKIEVSSLNLSWNFSYATELCLCYELRDLGLGVVKFKFKSHLNFIPRLCTKDTVELN